ncbi:D-glycero-beta-D-manno-heptose 1-phosphate adenylyltransferase [candidate division KSB1 bacterium]|nr:D-glycero-beta-D-manno-heptose 1-phosphate adenylyltransferase [candidate division KSB1 bacterium]
MQALTHVPCRLCSVFGLLFHTLYIKIRCIPGERLLCLKVFVTGKKRMNSIDLDRCLDSLNNASILVFGDLAIEETILGSIAEHSPEGPFPVVQTQNRILTPGFAGHVARLLQKWGARVSLCTLVGQDSAGIAAMQILAQEGIDIEPVIRDDQENTMVRTRVRVQGDHYPQREILRLYEPNPAGITDDQIDSLKEKLDSILPGFKALVIVDAFARLLPPVLLDLIKTRCKDHNILTIADSETALERFNGFDAVTPNLEQGRNYVDEKTGLEALGPVLLKKLSCKNVFLTLGQQGIQVSTPEDSRHVPTCTFRVFDVTGAGEAIVAGVAAGLTAGMSPEQTAQFANLAAGIVVTQAGLALVEPGQLRESAHLYSALSQAHKMVNLEQLEAALDQAKQSGKKVVWTNGCYDLLHAGHVLYLEKARQLGDLLVVGLNSDASVKASKGPLRPIVNETQRAKLLSALSFVDYVIIFDEQSPIKLIERLHPDIYAKGGDYNIETIDQPERRLVESYGGEIALLPGVEGMSTTHLIDRIIQAYGKPE